MPAPATRPPREVTQPRPTCRSTADLRERAPGIRTACIAAHSSLVTRLATLFAFRLRPPSPSSRHSLLPPPASRRLPPSDMHRGIRGQTRTGHPFVFVGRLRLCQPASTCSSWSIVHPPGSSPLASRLASAASSFHPPASPPSDSGRFLLPFSGRIPRSQAREGQVRLRRPPPQFPMPFRLAHAAEQCPHCIHLASAVVILRFLLQTNRWLSEQLLSTASCKPPLPLARSVRRKRQAFEVSAPTPATRRRPTLDSRWR